MNELELRFWLGPGESTQSIIRTSTIDYSARSGWRTNFFGKELFDQGELLRITETKGNDESGFWVTWKSRDIGHVANNRREIQKELRRGQRSVTLEVNHLGELQLPEWSYFNDVSYIGAYTKFMGFSGFSYHGVALDGLISIKEMHCDSISLPILVELESEGNEVDEIAFIERVKSILPNPILKRIVKIEPPGLLYQYRILNKPYEFN